MKEEGEANMQGRGGGQQGTRGSWHPGVTSRWAVPGDPASRVLTLITSRTTFGTPRTLHTQGTQTYKQAKHSYT